MNMHQLMQALQSGFIKGELSQGAISHSAFGFRLVAPAGTTEETKTGRTVSPAPLH